MIEVEMLVAIVAQTIAGFVLGVWFEKIRTRHRADHDRSKAE